MINYIVYIFTICYYGYFIYLRLNRKLYNIPLDENITQYYAILNYILIISTILSFLMVLIISLKYILKYIPSKTDETKHVWLKKGVVIVYNWYKKVNFVSKTYGYIFDLIGPNYTKYLITLAKYCVYWPTKLNIIIMLGFISLPRFLIIIILFSEILYGKLEYYFLSLFLLLIPLIFKFVIYMLADLGPRVLPEFQKFVLRDPSQTKTVEVETKDGKKEFFTMGFKLHPDHADLDLNHILENFFLPLSFIEGHMEYRIKPLYSKISQYTLLVYYLCHCIGLTYILYFL